MLETLALIPCANAVCAKPAFVVSIPYWYNALDCPINPLWKLFITSDKSLLDNEDQSADNILSAFDVAIEVSPSIPAEFVI